MEGGAELKNSTPRKNWEGISRREADGNAFLGEELWRGVRNYKTAPPRKNWEGISRREADGNAFLGEELWRGVRNYK